MNTIVALAAPKIFMDFPIWDEGYRLTLETKILKHFYLREIAHETVGLWRLTLDTYMNELMPVYNKMYTAVSQEFNPLFDVDITRTHDGTSTDSTNSSGNSVNKYSCVQSSVLSAQIRCSSSNRPCSHMNCVDCTASSYSSSFCTTSVIRKCERTARWIV